jgi:hypothetical protein
MSPALCRVLFLPLFVFALAPACSAKTDNPPLDTRGNKTPGSAVGSAPSAGADAAAEDSGTSAPVDAGSDAALCSAGGCNGCCELSTGLCQSGTTDALCGISASTCFACPTPMHCLNGFCQ